MLRIIFKTSDSGGFAIFHLLLFEPGILGPNIRTERENLELPGKSVVSLPKFSNGNPSGYLNFEYKIIG